MTSISLVKCLLSASTALVVATYFLYPGASFPVGREALECLLSMVVLIAAIILVSKYEDKLQQPFYRKSISCGLYIGLLWTIEISLNNFIHPGLPSRDIIDNIFWTIIAILILYLAISKSIQTKKMVTGIQTGLISGFSSGVVACLSALLLICFGMPLILKDPLNIIEWNDVKNTTSYLGMSVYFAYETLAGAILHLLVLGGLMGLVLGIIGGQIGKSINIIKRKSIPTSSKLL